MDPVDRLWVEPGGLEALAASWVRRLPIAPM